MRSGIMNKETLVWRARDENSPASIWSNNDDQIGRMYCEARYLAEIGRLVIAYLVQMFTIFEIRYSLVFGVAFAALYALVRAIRNRLKAKKVKELRMGSEVLLVGLIIGGFLWTPKVIEVIRHIINVLSLGWPTPIEPGSVSWYAILYWSAIFIGLIAWVLVLLGWRKTRRGESALKLSMTGGVVMALTGVMLFPGLLAIVGGVLSARKTNKKSPTAAIE